MHITDSDIPPLEPYCGSWIVVRRDNGRIQFRRESQRYSSGDPTGGDVLFIRIKGKACVFATYEPDAVTVNGKGLWANDGLYFKPRNAVHAGRRTHPTSGRTLKDSRGSGQTRCLPAQCGVLVHANG